MAHVTTPKDNKCQVSNCSNEHFTYCPHCQLFVCMVCVNQHHETFKQEFHQLIHCAKQQQQIEQTNLVRLHNQKNRILNLFNQQIRQNHEHQSYLTNKQTQSLSTIRPQDCQKLRCYLQQRAQLSDVLTLWTEKFDNLINEMEKMNRMPMAIDSKNYPNSNQQHRNDRSENSDDDEDDDIIVNTQGDKDRTMHSEQDNHNFFPEHHVYLKHEQQRQAQKPEQKNSNSSVYLTRALEHFRVETCPLTTWSFGLSSSKHGLRDIPCTRLVGSSVSLMNHLRHSHCLNYRASLQITRLIASGAQWHGVDLFSNLPTGKSIANLSAKTFRGQCPLTKLGVYGLNQFHDILLCMENDHQRENIHLLNHFISVHGLSSFWATRLVTAIIKGDRSQIFDPHVPIKGKRLNKISM